MRHVRDEKLMDYLVSRPEMATLVPPFDLLHAGPSENGSSVVVIVATHQLVLMVLGGKEEGTFSTTPTFSSTSNDDKQRRRCTALYQSQLLPLQVVKRQGQ